MSNIFRVNCNEDETLDVEVCDELVDDRIQRVARIRIEDEYGEALARVDLTPDQMERLGNFLLQQEKIS